VSFFDDSTDFEKINGVWCQKSLGTNEFEQAYLDIRKKEGRLHDDDTVMKMPFIAGSTEWKIRANSAKQLIKRLRKENCKSLIEIGCGNGWLSNYIQKELNIDVCGIDIARFELEQAARISQGRSVFVRADIFSLRDMTADVVLLASCTQYFPDLKKLIEHLVTIGTVHIIDSPFYEKGEAEAARRRSSTYFDSKGAPAMKSHYFHHEADSLHEFDPVFLHRPTPFNRILNASPFPWIRIAGNRHDR
jgi:SAM-dependent methyltransferase